MQPTINLFIPRPGEALSENDTKLLMALKKNIGKSTEAYAFIDAAMVAYLQNAKINANTYYMDENEDYSEDREDINRLEKSTYELSLPMNRLDKWIERVWELRRIDFSAEEIAKAREITYECINASLSLKADYDEMRDEARVLENAGPLDAEFQELKEGFQSVHTVLAAL